MAIVIDASVTACWCFPDESSAAADLAMERLIEDEALVPALWRVEMCNILVVNERRGRIDSVDSERFLEDLATLPIRVRPEDGYRTLLSLSRNHGLTAYDAAYLALAVRAGAPLATLDRPLARAARTAGVELIGPR